MSARLSNRARLERILTALTRRWTSLAHFILADGVVVSFLAETAKDAVDKPSRGHR